MGSGKAYWDGKHYAFFQNRECEYFPCHKTEDPERFNCLFCYCPLYSMGKQCGGNFRYTENGYKDCTNCMVPHRPENYGLITEKYGKIMEVLRREDNRWRNPVPCVSVLVVRDEQVLLGLRGKSRIMPGKWCLPCGHIEWGESYFDAAKREVFEETGLEVRPLRVINVVSNHFTEVPGTDDGYESLVIVILAVPVDGSERAGDDLKALTWVPVDGPFPEMAFKGDVHIISQYQRYGSQFGISFSETQDQFREINTGSGS